MPDRSQALELSELYAKLQAAAAAVASAADGGGDDGHDGESAADAACSALAAAVAGLGSVGAEDDRAAEAERLLACVNEALLGSGARGLALLDEILLTAYPHLSSLATLSDGCLAHFAALSAAAAEHCSPRDAITALLEAVDALLHGAGDAPWARPGGGDEVATAAAALAVLVPLLAPLLSRLQRRRVAFAREALAPVVAAAKLVGGLMHGGGGGGGGSGADGGGFEARQLRVFVDFACGVESDVLAAAQAGGAAAEREACARSLAQTVLQLLAHLTLGWLGTRVDDGAGSAGAHATGEEVKRLLRLLRGRLGVESWDDLERCSTASVAAAAAAAAVSEAAEEQGAASASGEDDDGSGGSGDDARAGAALAALHGLDLGCGPEPPSDGVALLTASCRLAQELAAAAQREDSQGAVQQALQLLLLGARRACGAPDRQPAEGAGESTAAAAVAADRAEAVARDMGPAAAFLSSVMLQAGPDSDAGKAARAAWTAALEAVRPAPLRLAVLGSLLEAQHPEVCALLLARARQDAAAGALGAGECWRLCAPWLSPDGPRGWRGAGGDGESDGALASNANAVCAALNLLRLLLLRRLQRGGGGGDGDGGGGSSSELPDSAEMAATLAPLAAAVQAALARLRAEAGGCCVEDGGGGGEGGEDEGGGVEATPIVSSSSIAGEAQGVGGPVDAWLAISRVDDVLQRVLELCDG